MESKFYKNERSFQVFVCFDRVVKLLQAWRRCSCALSGIVLVVWVALNGVVRVLSGVVLVDWVALNLWIEWPWSCGLNGLDLVDWVALNLWIEWHWFCGLSGVVLVDWMSLFMCIKWRCCCALSGVVVVHCVALLQWVFRLPHASQNGNLTVGLPHDNTKSIHNMNKINALASALWMGPKLPGWNFNLTDTRTKA